ncbi:MAG: DUF4013 domain-containing protein [Herpetosiphonaceae bacterium]|nr:DUF4013 domain-containing protein [Herpetosiphonaceae bacterium]
MAEPATFNAYQSLRQALATVFSDRRWPIKIAIGGAFMLTIIGVVFPQGFLIEHLDNSRRGFRTPLPGWRQWSDKAVMGMLAAMFDFVYFLLPIIAAALGLFCAIIPLLFSDSAAAEWSTRLIVAVLGSIILLSFGLSFSPIAKIYFAKDGDIEHNVGPRMLSRIRNPLTRHLYYKARLASLPVYGPALLAGAGLFMLIQRSGSSVWLTLGVAWLTASLFFGAWLITGQIYLAAVEIAEDMELDARLAERRATLSNE